MFRSALLLAIISITSHCVFGQEHFVVKKDLRSDWMQYENGKYVLLGDETPAKQSIYFTIAANRFLQSYLFLKSPHEYTLFVNGKLALTNAGESRLSLDSLSKMFGGTLSCSVYQEAGIGGALTTTIIAQNAADHANQKAFAKPANDFKDFATVTGLLLIIFFVVIIRAYPKLAADYFSVKRILSIREAEDNQSHARFALASNIAFYVFCSFLIALCLMIVIQHLPDTYLIVQHFKSTGFWNMLFQWFKLSAVVGLVLIGKIAVVFALSSLFGFRGIAGVHYFNWIRLLLVCMSALSVIIFIYFISRGLSPEVYISLLTVFIILLVGWIIIVFLKLNNRTEHSMFHLFSYICATEVIPLIITIKVLFQ